MNNKLLLSSVLALIMALTTVMGSALAGSYGPIGEVFPVSTSSQNEVHAAVAHNDEKKEFLVVFHEETTQDDNIRAVLMSEFGQQLKEFYLTGSYINRENRYPDVTYNPDRKEFLVVWQEYFRPTTPGGKGEHRIMGQIVTQNGDPAPQTITIYDYGTQGYLGKPVVDYATKSKRYLVAFEGRTWLKPLPTVMARFLKGDGQLDGASFDVYPTPTGDIYGGYNPDLVYDQSEDKFMVVWELHVNAMSTVFGKIVNADGSYNPPLFTITQGNNNEINPSVAVKPTSGDGGLFLVATESAVSEFDHGIATYLISGNGANILADYKSSYPFKPTNPAVASDGCDFLLVWSQAMDADLALPLIHGEMIDETGKRFDYAPVVMPLSMHPAVASGREGRYLIASQIGGRYSWEMVGRIWIDFDKNIRQTFK